MKKYQSPWLAASILAFSFAGCAGLNDSCYENTQKLRAVREYVSCGNPGCERFPHDYKLGWIDGFYNISTGGPSCPPAVAPQRYWNPKQVLKDCDNRRHAYYSGWQDGASRATQFPDTHQLKIFETCECPMPRCESACGTAGCVPCGLGSVGSPVHAELIEMPYEQESIIPTPIVPPAPIDDDEEDEDEGMVDDDDESASLAPEMSTEQIAMPTIEMLETETIEAEAFDAAANEELVRKNDASSIFGSAFDVIRNESSTVRLQELDPMENAKAANENSVINAKPEELETDAIKVAESEPKIVVPSPTIRTVQEAKRSPVQEPAEDLSEGTVQLVKDNLVPPAIETASKSVANEDSVAKTKSTNEQTPEPKQLTVKKSSKSNKVQPKLDRPTRATRHPAVAKETIPVRFEMIESDLAGKPATVVQAK